MNKIESYVDSVIPKNIPKSKQQKLRAELEAHIFDRIDFYTDIGYDTDASINKALADMGEDEEIKTSIRNDFEELHHERIWVSVLTGLGMLFLHCLSFLYNWGYYDGLDDYRPVVYGQGDTSGAEYGFITTFIVIMAIVILYKKGYRKCLITLGVTNLLTIPISAYIYGAIFSLYEVIAFLAVKTMSIQYSVISYDCENAFYTISYCLLICLSLICFGLANRIRHNGKPGKGYKGIIVFCMVYFAISVFTISFIVPAEKYFYFYPGWFNTELDMPNESSESVYDSLNNHFTPEYYLGTLNGYTTVEKYANTFDEDTAKKIMDEFGEMEFFFGDDYEVWFDPDFIEQYDEFDGNGFIFIQRDEKGFIKSKGVGNAFSDLSTVKGEYGNIPDEVQTFLSYKGGEKLTDVLDYFSKEYGTIYCEFTTYTETGEDNYYRIVCNGHCPYDMWNSKGAICDIYIELWFENGALTDGKLHYPEFHYQEDEEVYSYSYDNYYTLAD